MKKIFGIILLIASFNAYCAGGKLKKMAANFKKGSIAIVMTVDWEGREISDENLEALKNFRRKYPGIPILHFLNAAYYTKPNANAAELTKKIKSVMRKHDEHGLHIHAWKTLVEASGVEFKTKPDLGGWSLRNCQFDCGHAISLTAYSVDEMQKIIRKSNEILVQNGFNRPKSFRAGAWQTGPHVATALSREGFYLDSSATVDSFVSPSWGKSSLLVKSINELWPGMSIVKQPYLMKTAYRPLWQLPNNASLADYTKPYTILKTLKENVDEFLKNPRPVHYVVTGFHLETAKRYLPRMEEALEKIIDYSMSKGVPIQFSHFPLNLK